MENSFCKQKRKKAAVTCSVTQMKSYTGITASVVSCQRPSVASRLKLSSWKKMQTSLMGDCIILSLAFNQMKLVPWTDIANKGPHSFIFFFSFLKRKSLFFGSWYIFKMTGKIGRTKELRNWRVTCQMWVVYTHLLLWGERDCSTVCSAELTHRLLTWII